MIGNIALVGGEEFRPGCEKMDGALLNATGVRSPRVLVVPTAAAFENPYKAARNGVNYFSDLGANASSLMVLDSVSADDERILTPVDDAHIIYFTGGDPRYLLATLTESLFLNKLKYAHQQGAILVGSSAGAMVLGSWMKLGGWVEALGIADGFAVIPHYEDGGPTKMAKGLEDTPYSDLVILGIDSKVCCFGLGLEWEVIGTGSVTVYSGTRHQKYHNGQSMFLSSFKY